MKYAITEDYDNTLYFESSYDPFDVIFDTLSMYFIKKYRYHFNELME